MRYLDTSKDDEGNIIANYESDEESEIEGASSTSLADDGEDQSENDDDDDEMGNQSS